MARQAGTNASRAEWAEDGDVGVALPDMRERLARPTSSSAVASLPCGRPLAAATPPRSRPKRHRVRPRVVAMNQVPEQVGALIEGVGSRRLRHALGLLLGDRPWDADGLAAATAAPRRTVDALLSALGDDLDGRAHPAVTGRRHTAPLRSPTLQPTRSATCCPSTPRPSRRWNAWSAPRPGRVPLSTTSPRPPTPPYAARCCSASRFWLGGARLLCVGDHDLTCWPSRSSIPRGRDHRRRHRRAHPGVHR